MLLCTWWVLLLNWFCMPRGKYLAFRQWIKIPPNPSQTESYMITYIYICQLGYISVCCSYLTLSMATQAISSMTTIASLFQNVVWQQYLQYSSYVYRQLQIYTFCDLHIYVTLFFLHSYNHTNTYSLHHIYCF